MMAATVPASYNLAMDEIQDSMRKSFHNELEQHTFSDITLISEDDKHVKVDIHIPFI